MTDPRLTAAAEAIEDAAMLMIGRDLGTLHRNDIVQAGLDAADAVDPVRAQPPVIAIHLEDYDCWENLEALTGGTIQSTQDPSGEYTSRLHLPGVGVAHKRDWILLHPDHSITIVDPLDFPRNVWQVNGDLDDAAIEDGAISDTVAAARTDVEAIGEQQP
jgi:hypothetical protein